MNTFLERLRGHIAHVKNVGEHCSTEETTKQALILPLLDILGFSPYDPMRVRAEYAADFPGAKAGERVDYALFCQGVPVMYVEAKAYGEKLVNHHPQLSRYFNATPEVTIAAVTNGREWRFFTYPYGDTCLAHAPPSRLCIRKCDGYVFSRGFCTLHFSCVCGGPISPR